MTACRPTGGKTNYNSSLLQADAEGKRQPAGTLQPLGTVSYGLRLAGLVLQVPAGAGPKAGWRLPNLPIKLQIILQDQKTAQRNVPKKMQ